MSLKHRCLGIDKHRCLDKITLVQVIQAESKRLMNVFFQADLAHPPTQVLAYSRQGQPRIQRGHADYNGAA